MWNSHRHLQHDYQGAIFSFWIIATGVAVGAYLALAL